MSDVQSSAAPEAAPQSQETSSENQVNQEQSATVQPAGEQKLDAQKESVKDSIRKLNIKVDGEEIEEMIDVANEEELKKILQMAKMSQKRAQEAAELRKNELRTKKDIQDFFNLIQKDPRAVMAKLGINQKQLAEEIMNEEMEREAMDPKELENLELKKQLKQIMEEKEQERVRLAEIEKERMREKYAGEYEKDLMDSIKENGLPENPEYVMRAINLLKIANDAQIDLKFKDVMPLVKEQVLDNIKALLPQFDLDTIEKIVQEDKISELYKRKKAKQAPKAQAKPAVPPTANSIVDTGAAKEVEKEIPKFKTRDPKKFWSSF